jgi:hypothetical protein
MPPDFTPSPEAESILLQQLASPESSLTYLARVNGTTVDALSLWMARPDIMEKCRAIVTAGMMQTKMVVATRLNMCVKGLITIVAAAVEADAHTPAPIAFHDRRLREQQRRNSIRAVTLILRCGSYDPFTPARTPRDRNTPDNAPSSTPSSAPPSDPRLISNPKTWADLKDLIAQRDADEAATKREGDSSRVACLLEEQACSHDHTSSPTPDDLHGCATGCEVGGPTSANSSTPAPPHPHRTASVSERISSSESSLPSQPVHPAGALPDLPLASALKDDANSPRVACLLEEQACADDHTSAMPPDPPDSTASPFVPTSPCPSAPSTTPSPWPSVALRGEPLSPRSAFASPPAPHARGDPS